MRDFIIIRGFCFPETIKPSRKFSNVQYQNLMRCAGSHLLSIFNTGDIKIVCKAQKMKKSLFHTCQKNVRIKYIHINLKIKNKYSKLKHTNIYLILKENLNNYLIPSKKRTVPVTFSKCFYPLLETVWIQISWLLMKPADQDPHCFTSTQSIQINYF